MNYYYNRGFGLLHSFTLIFFLLMTGCSKDSVNEPGETNTAYIKQNNVQQVVRGFGAANILPWRPDMTTAEVNKAFGTVNGQIGFTILRLRIPSDSSEFALNVPTAKLAHSMGAIIIASPWSPPAWMKSNNNIVRGRLNDNNYAAYAAHLKSFVDYMSENGVPVYAVSIQNEPDVSVSYESCDWNASEITRFIKEYGPTIGTKIIAPESYQFRRELSDPLLNDDSARKNFDIVGGHIYDGGLESYPLARAKGKEVWMTEHLVLETDWKDNLATGKEILDCMNAGMNAYIWWYIVRFYGPLYDDGAHPDTPAGAVQGEISKRGYVMSQFARFVRPGFFRIDATANPQSDIFVTAFKNENRIVIVAVNTASSSKTQKFTLEGHDVINFTPYLTTEIKNCSSEPGIPVSGNSFTATLEAMSITTFVSD